MIIVYHRLDRKYHSSFQLPATCSSGARFVSIMASFLRLATTARFSRKFTSTCIVGFNKSSASLSLQKNLPKLENQICCFSTLNSHGGSVQAVGALQSRFDTPVLSVPCERIINQGLINSNYKQHMFTRTYSTLQNGHQYSSIFSRNSIFSTRSHIASFSFSLRRYYSSDSKDEDNQRGMRNKTVMMYMFAVFILAIGVTYAAVPLYTVFCQATGYGGVVKEGHDIAAVETMKPMKKRPLLIQFNADTAASMRWNFKPQQREVVVYPGETALAFYSAVNPTDKPIIGISTYNVLPFEAGKYFNKIQCFCFEEQRLNPYEQVDMPVFFFIDPEFAADRKMDKVENIVLSYTFFEAKEGLKLPDPMERR